MDVMKEFALEFPSRSRALGDRTTRCSLQELQTGHRRRSPLTQMECKRDGLQQEKMEEEC
jgi:hypothetical protein